MLLFSGRSEIIHNCSVMTLTLVKIKSPVNKSNLPILTRKISFQKIRKNSWFSILINEYTIQKIKMSHNLSCLETSFRHAVLLIVYCTSASTSLSDSVSYTTFLFLEWSIHNHFVKIHFTCIFENVCQTSVVMSLKCNSLFRPTSLIYGADRIN